MEHQSMGANLAHCGPRRRPEEEEKEEDEEEEKEEEVREEWLYRAHGEFWGLRLRRSREG